MLGHGRPSWSRTALALFAHVLCAAVPFSVPAQDFSRITSAFSSTASPPAASPVPQTGESKSSPVRLRLTWGGGETKQWNGQVRLDRGTMSRIKLLGNEADAAGSAWLESGALRIGDLSPHAHDSVEVNAVAPPDAQLLLEFASTPNESPIKAQVSIAELARRAFELRLDDHGNTLQLALVPPPTMQIKFSGDPQQRDTGIYAPGDQLSFEVLLDLPASLQGTNVDVHTRLSAGRGRESLWADDQKLAVTLDGHSRINLNVPLAQMEGVYTVYVAVARPSGYFSDKFFKGAPAPIAERNFQVIVLDPKSSPAKAESRWMSVLEIDPTNPAFIDRLPAWTQLRKIPGLSLNRAPFGNIRAGVVNSPLGRFIELPPNPAGGESHWQAYTLPIEKVGMPHLLEVDYPANEEQHFGLSIVQPNSLGEIEGAQRDAGVYVEGLGRQDLKQRQTQRVLFWPHTQAPLLVVTNQHPTAAAHFGQIRVLRCMGPLSAGASAATPKRMVAAYIADPLAAENFGAMHSAESATTGEDRQPTNEAQTAFETASRLADYLGYAGYNAAVVSTPPSKEVREQADSPVVSDSSLAPQASFDAREVDALEVTLRVFDRQRLTLVPALKFTGPIPELEALRRQIGAQASGLELVGADGRTWLETNHARDGRAPYYNLLDPRVQQAMLDRVRELVERYRDHPSFGGIAIQLSSDGYTQLPPAEWGLDDATMARFSREMRITVPDSGEQRFAARSEALKNQYAEVWKSWRTRQVADFYRRAAAIVRGNSDRKLLLTTDALFDHPKIAELVRPSLSIAEDRVGPTLLELGIDRTQLAQISGLMIGPSLYAEPMHPLADRAVDLEVNAALSQWREPPTSDSIEVYYRPHSLRLETFTPQFGVPARVKSDLRFDSTPLRHGVCAREPYLRALLQGDSAIVIDGSRMLPLAQDELLRPVRETIAQLPLAAQVANFAKQPVFVRTYTESKQLTVVVMNVSPWVASAEVTLEVPNNPNLAPLAAPNANAEGAIKTLTLAAGQQPWSVKLEPYEIRAVRINSPGAKVTNVTANVSEDAHKELKAQLEDLVNRDLSAPHSYNALSNPSFEPIGGALAGWTLKTQGATAQLDGANPQDGKTSLYLSGVTQGAVVESETFRAPATGQLAMTVFARGNNLQPGSDLRLAFIVEGDGQTFRSSATVKGNSLANQNWGRSFAFTVPDLPLNSDSKMRVVLELTGPGEVWLDNVKLYDIVFPLKFNPNAQAEIVQLLKLTHAAQSAYQNQRCDVSDCLGLMDGYWPRFVKANTPLRVPQLAAAPSPPNGKPAAPSASGSPPAPANGFGDQIKRMVPLWR